MGDLGEVDLGAPPSDGLRSRRRPASGLAASARASTLVETIKKADVFPKVESDFVEGSNAGAFATAVLCVAAIALVVMEGSVYVSGEDVDHLSVDLTRHEKLNINLDISFHALPCSEVNIDVMDVMGDPMLRMQSHIKKTRLDAAGDVLGVQLENTTEPEREKAVLRTKARDECGDCHVPPPDNNNNQGEGEGEGEGGGGEGRCCNTCQDVKDAMRARGWDNVDDLAKDTEQCRREQELHKRLSNAEAEGCRVSGYIEVNKIAGNFHFAPGKTFVSRHGHHIHEFNPQQASRFNVSHTIHGLSFGEHAVPGVDNLLDGTTRISESGPGVFQYFVKVVPTTFEKEGNVLVDSYQYAVTEHRKGSGHGHFILPGVFVMYDLAPIRVTITHTRPSLASFLTRLCAVVGGLFTVSGFVHSVARTLSRALKRGRRRVGGMDF